MTVPLGNEEHKKSLFPIETEIFSLLCVFVTLGDCQAVTAIIEFIVRMAFDPVESHGVGMEQIIQCLPQVRIFQFSTLAFPPGFLPAIQPMLIDGIANILAVRI